jgi:hypothetical protein
MTKLFQEQFLSYKLGMDSVDGTGIHASAAVDTGVCVDNALAALLADGVDRTGILTCCAVGAIVSNGM